MKGLQSGRRKAAFLFFQPLSAQANRTASSTSRYRCLFNAAIPVPETTCGQGAAARSLRQNDAQDGLERFKRKNKKGRE
jgi:hypothetical protein